MLHFKWFQSSTLALGSVDHEDQTRMDLFLRRAALTSGDSADGRLMDRRV